MDFPIIYRRFWSINMKPYYLFISLIVLFLCSANIIALTGESKAVSEVVKNYNARGDFEGVVLVAKGGRVIHKQAVGLANREWKIPHRLDTRFRICSITKQFTAVLVMQLVEAGKLNLDTPVSEYLPDFRKNSGGKITLRNLLSSSSGLPTFDDLAFWQKDDEQLASASFTAMNYISSSSSSGLSFEPGAKFNYNNADFILVGAILEQISGKSFEQLLQEKILQPLGMKRTGILKQKEITENLASGYIKQNSQIFKEPYFHIQNYSSAGAMYSTAEDMLLWNTALLTNKLLSEKYRNEMFAPIENLGFVALGSWSYPLELPNGRKITVVERQGYIGGFCALNIIVPGSDLSLVFLSNTETQTLFMTYAKQGLSYEVIKTLDL
jgi:CubicO group peptidase (beta-lactamase class C family)